MTKILCIGSGNLDADKKAKIFSLKNRINYQGLLDTVIDPPPGCYHTSIIDLPIWEITSIAAKFNTIVLIDQDAREYNTTDDYYLTVKLANDLKVSNDVIFLNPDQNFTSVTDLAKNKSLCILPFSAFLKGGNTVVPCCDFLGGSEFSDRTKSFDFMSDRPFQTVRDRMLAGLPVPECNICTKIEDVGATSPRLVNSEEWFIKLGINSIEKIKTQDRLYDVRLGNKCNLLCRTCNPISSILIDREYFNIKLQDQECGEIVRGDFNVVKLDTVERVYVAGGEPSIDSIFSNFMKECIKVGRIDFELVINTNAVSLSQEFLGLVSKFPKIKFEISVDGFGLVNQYIRWPSKWDKLTKNIQKLHDVSNGSISFNTVASIYNVGNLYHCIRYLDNHYPKAQKHLTYLFSPEKLQPWKFPDKAVALDDLRQMHNLTCYNEQPVFRSKVQGLERKISDYQNSHEEIYEFFEWNDRLDASRNVKLADYIPELDKYRPKND